MAAQRTRINVLAGSYIERDAHLRKDAAWQQTAIEQSDSLFVPVWRNRNLVKHEAGSTRAVLIDRNHALFAALRANERDLTFLGHFNERPCFACEVATDVELANINARDRDALNGEPQIEYQDLRAVASLVPRDEAGLLAYARALITWRARNKFCGVCGAPTQLKQAGHVLQCADPECSTQQFPRSDPAIIVLVTDGTRALLGRQAAWAPGRYSTIAGFVEPGESLEDAVAREVREETGVIVDEVAYHSSQPWPFPASLMLGFIATAKTTEIVRIDDELEDVQWFTREDIASGKCGLPPAISVSGCLIEDWYDSAAQVPLREELAAQRWQTGR